MEEEWKKVVQEKSNHIENLKQSNNTLKSILLQQLKRVKSDQSVLREKSDKIKKDFQLYAVMAKSDFTELQKKCADYKKQMSEILENQQVLEMNLKQAEEIRRQIEDHGKMFIISEKKLIAERDSLKSQLNEARRMNVVLEKQILNLQQKLMFDDEGEIMALINEHIHSVEGLRLENAELRDANDKLMKENESLQSVCNNSKHKN